MRKTIVAALATTAALTVPAAAHATGNHDKPTKPTCSGPGSIQCPPGQAGPAGPQGPQGPPGVTTIVTRTEVVTVIQERQCVSQRLQRPLLRRRYPGVSNNQGFRVVGIDTNKTKTVAGVLERGVWTGMDTLGNNIATDYTLERIDGAQRIRLWIDTRGRTFTGFDNDLRTTVWLRVRLDNGSLASRRVIYKSAVCRSEQGNPNDENARSPEIPGV